MADNSVKKLPPIFTGHCNYCGYTEIPKRHFQNCPYWNRGKASVRLEKGTVEGDKDK